MKPKHLLKATPTLVHNNSLSVRITKAKRTRQKTSGCIRLTAVVSSRSRSNVKHRVMIEANDPKAKALYNSDVKVWCDCEFFHFMGCSDVLPRHKAGFPDKASGIMPDEKNPRYIPFVCLHVVRALNALIRANK